MRHLIISYVGIDFMGPDAFPCPPNKVAGAPELVESLLSLGAFSNPLFGGSGTSEYKLDDTEISAFLGDIVRRFAPDGELPDVLSDVIRGLLWHASLAKLQAEERAQQIKLTLDTCSAGSLIIAYR